MKESKDNLKVIFRKHNEEIIAFFPELSHNLNDMVCYAHIGQHSEASMEFYRECKPCNESEYKSLLNELKSIYDDCNLIVSKKITKYNYKPFNN